jgi:hypothetical protein
MELLTVRETARLLDCSPAALYQRRTRGDHRLPVLSVADRVIRYLRTDVEAFIASGHRIPRRNTNKKKAPK